MVFKRGSRAFPAHYPARSLAALPLTAIFLRYTEKFQGSVVPSHKYKCTHEQTCVAGSVYVNLVNRWWEEVGGKESRVSGGFRMWRSPGLTLR